MINRPRIKPFTNKRMGVHQFVRSWSIWGWSLGAKVNVVRESQVKGGEELSALTPSVLDKVFKGDL